MNEIYAYFFWIARWFIALSSIGLAISWGRYFYKTKPKNKILAALVTTDGFALDVSVGENIIGRSSSADIVIPVRGVQKRHAILSLKNNHWFLASAGILEQDYYGIVFGTRKNRLN